MQTLTRWMLFAAALGVSAPLRAAPAPDGKTAPTVTLPRLALLNFQAKNGVSKDTVDALTDNIASELRRMHQFASVVTTEDLNAAVGLEKQKDLLGCNQDSCMTELAGLLGVDYLLSGNVALIGNSYLLNLRLVKVRNGMSASSVSQRIPTGADDALLDAVPGALRQLLLESGVTTGTPAASPSTAPKASSSLLPGVITAAAGFALLVPVFVLLGAAVMMQLVPRVVPLPAFGVIYEVRWAGLYTVTFGAIGIALGGLMGALALDVTGALLLVRSLM